VDIRFFFQLFENRGHGSELDRAISFLKPFRRAATTRRQAAGRASLIPGFPFLIPAQPQNRTKSLILGCREGVGKKKKRNWIRKGKEIEDKGKRYTKEGILKEESGSTQMDKIG
jgi:hypothetical protein